MASDDWYRSDRWRRSDRSEFERRLAAVRPAERGEYLRIKGITLTDTGHTKLIAAGTALLERCIAEVGEESHSAAGAHFELARQSEHVGDLEGAVRHFEATLAFERKYGSPRHGTELALAELIARSPGLTSRLAQAEELLAEPDLPPFRSDQLRFATTHARLASRRGNHDHAAAYACGAFWLLGHDRPINGRHPTVGLIGDEVDTALLDELEDLVRAGDPEAVGPAIDAFRGPDGEVRWDWALVERLAGVGRGHPDRRAEEVAYAATVAPILADLRAAGFDAYDLDDWSRRKLGSAKEVRTAAEILVPWFQRTDNLRIQTEITWALKDPRARRLAAAAVIDRFDALADVAISAKQRLESGEEDSDEVVGDRARSLASLKLALGNALDTLARDEHFDRIAAIIHNPAHGGDRAYAFWPLGYMKVPQAVDLAIEMLDDPSVRRDALHALVSLKSDRAEPVLESIALAGDRDDAKLAVHGLALLRKAQAAGKSRP